MQQQHARLRGHGDANLVSDFEPAAALEVFLGEEHLHVTSELGSVRDRQARGIGNILLDDGRHSGGNGRWRMAFRRRRLK